MENNTEKKLYKSQRNKMLAGVCGGMGESFNIDPTLVRLAFVALCIFAGGGLLAYIVALIIVPEEPAGYVPPKPNEAAAQTQTPPEATDEKKEPSDSSDHNSPTMI